MYITGFGGDPVFFLFLETIDIVYDEGFDCLWVVFNVDEVVVVGIVVQSNCRS